MKKVVYLMVLLLCLNMVMAGESFDLDFSGAKTVAVVMSQGDEVRFEMLGATHSIILDGVSESSVEFNIVPFVGESSSVKTGFVTLDTIAKVDLDMDGIVEINVALYSVDEDGVTTMVFQSLADESTEDVDPEEEGVVEPDMPEWKSTVLKVIAVCVVILVVFYIFRGKKEEEDSGLSAEEEKEVDDLLDKAEKEMKDE